MKRRTLISAASVSGLSAKISAQERNGKKLARRIGDDQRDHPKLWAGDDNIPTFPTDPGSHPASLPYLFFKLSAQDNGDPKAPRTTLQEYMSRKPLSVEWKLADRVVLLHVTNGGAAASDLYRVDYNLIYCTWPLHKPTDGFSVTHAEEANGSSADDLLTADFLLPSVTRAVVINIEPFATLKNIYIRARVSTLMSPIVDKKDWNFATDPRVVEGWTSYEAR